MKMKLVKILSIFCFLVLFNACDSGTDVVESGTYEGVIKEVEPEKTEIYVETADNKTLELYFTETTTVTQKGENVSFSSLKEGQKVEVQVEKVGQRLDPVSVKIIE